LTGLLNPLSFCTKLFLSYFVNCFNCCFLPPLPVAIRALPDLCLEIVSVSFGVQNWTPMVGQIWKPIDTLPGRSDAASAVGAIGNPSGWKRSTATSVLGFPPRERGRDYATSWKRNLDVLVPLQNFFSSDDDAGTPMDAT
jgi:hypothetical protein